MHTPPCPSAQLQRLCQPLAPHPSARVGQDWMPFPSWPARERSSQGQPYPGLSYPCTSPILAPLLYPRTLAYRNRHPTWASSSGNPLSSSSACAAATAASCAPRRGVAPRPKAQNCKAARLQGCGLRIPEGHTQGGRHAAPPVHPASAACVQNVTRGMTRTGWRPVYRM